MTPENAENFNNQVEQLTQDLEEALQGFIGQPIESIVGAPLSDIAKEIFSSAAMLPPMDLVVRRISIREGAKPLRTHKKRIMKKWLKRNTIIEEETLFKGCTIIGGEF